MLMQMCWRRMLCRLKFNCAGKHVSPRGKREMRPILKARLREQARRTPADACSPCVQACATRLAAASVARLVRRVHTINWRSTCEWTAYLSRRQVAAAQDDERSEVALERVRATMPSGCYRKTMARTCARLRPAAA